MRVERNKEIKRARGRNSKRVKREKRVKDIKFEQLLCLVQSTFFLTGFSFDPIDTSYWTWLQKSLYRVNVLKRKSTQRDRLEIRLANDKKSLEEA